MPSFTEVPGTNPGAGMDFYYGQGKLKVNWHADHVSLSDPECVIRLAVVLYVYMERRELKNK